MPTGQSARRWRLSPWEPPGAPAASVRPLPGQRRFGFGALFVRLLPHTSSVVLLEGCCLFSSWVGCFLLARPWVFGVGCVFPFPTLQKQPQRLAARLLPAPRAAPSPDSLLTSLQKALQPRQRDGEGCCWDSWGLWGCEGSALGSCSLPPGSAAALCQGLCAPFFWGAPGWLWCLSGASPSG